MKRPSLLIVAMVAGAILVAGAGASAHSISLIKSPRTHTATTAFDEASGARTESPELEEAPEASPTAKPSERPAPAENKNEPAETENENENANQDNDANEQEHEGDHHGDGGDHHDGGDD
jgi:hypothetical protein